MKKEEMMLKATQMLAKGKFKLKKAGPTIMSTQPYGWQRSMPLR